MGKYPQKGDIKKKKRKVSQYKKRREKTNIMLIEQYFPDFYKGNVQSFKDIISFHSTYLQSVKISKIDIITTHCYNISLNKKKLTVNESKNIAVAVKDELLKLENPTEEKLCEIAARMFFEKKNN